MAISKRLRYEVLRRDNHTCRYCGARAPEAQLVVDAVVPEALGGSHKDSANLVTACDPCNSGKSSSSPDAPLVADVAADALRWARAIQRAQAEMLADIKAREADQEQFREWWDAWKVGTGENARPVPKEPGWRQTVTQLTSAGLPLAVLRECVELAMSRQSVKAEGTFRYMCGIAWKKVAQIQSRAHDLTSNNIAEEQASAYDQGRMDVARLVLQEIDDEAELELLLQGSGDGGYSDAHGKPETEADRLSRAARDALNTYVNLADRFSPRHAQKIPAGESIVAAP